MGCCSKIFENIRNIRNVGIIYEKYVEFEMISDTHRLVNQQRR